MKKILPVALLLLALLIALPAAGLLAWRQYAPPEQAPQSVSEVPAAPVPTPEPVRATPAPPARATLLACGDNLIHDTLFNQAAARADGAGYDFLPLYARVADRIAGADIAFINQETMMDPTRPPSGYPAFNSPPVLAEHLAATGFDVLNLANNHMLDMGLGGLSRTAEVLAAVPGVTRIGAWRDGEDKLQIPVLERQGITFAFVGFAEYTNIGGSAHCRDNIVYTDDLETMAAQMARARERADVVVASVHFGTENSTIVNPAQRETARRLCDLGADIVLGHHPHVVQAIETLSAPDGRETLVFYSLGNFVSAQRIAQNLVGLMPEITVEKDPASGKISLTAEIIPVVTHYGSGMRELSVYPVAEYTQDLAAAHGVSAFGTGTMSLEFIRQLLSDAVGAPYFAA